MRGHDIKQMVSVGPAAAKAEAVRAAATNNKPLESMKIEKEMMGNGVKPARPAEAKAERSVLQIQ